MVFSSATFIFVFLPVVTALYYIPFFKDAPQAEMSKKNLILCLASLVFYAWGEPIYVVLMLISIYFNYLMAIDMQDCIGKPAKRKALFITAILFNILVLGYFKYYPFITENINSIFSLDIKVSQLALPVGISFYTFQIISYIVDVYRGDALVQRSLLDFATYISMFPQLIAGPIVQYNDIERQLSERKMSVRKFSAGVLFFVRGLGKKVIFANTIGAVYTQVCSNGIDSLGALSAWFGILCYTLQIYFDFSGYSDMAVGLGKMFGFDFVQNFNFPYSASSIKDFWSRWHISLSSWFRDYVYIPLGGNRKGKVRTVINIAVVWTLTGLWHGAAWNFVAWGAFYGILLIGEKYIFSGILEKTPYVIKRIVTMFIVVIGWVFFSSTSFSDSVVYLQSMFGANGLMDENTKYIILSNIFPFTVMTLSSVGAFRKVPKLKNSTANLVLYSLGYAVVFVLSVVFLISDTYNPFLYFRF